MYKSTRISVAITVVTFLLFLLSLLTSALSDDERPTTIGTVTEPPDSTIPSDVAAPENQKFVFLLFVEGQIQYKCARSKWTIDTMEGKLYNTKGEALQQLYKVGSYSFHKSTDFHVWSGSLRRDTSRLYARMDAKIPSPSHPTNYLFWARYLKRSTIGTGSFATVKTIVQMNTRMGAPPSDDECGEDKKYEAGTKVTEKYSAQHLFYG